MMHKLAALAALAALFTPLLPAQEVLAIKAGTVNLGNGQPLITDAVILIKDGRIEAIGKDVEVPWNAKVLDASKGYVMAAWVQASASGGLDRANENIQVTPFLSVMDSIEPAHRYFDACRRYGIGTIHILPGNACAIGGRGVIVKPDGKTPETMALIESAGMKLSLQPKGGRSKHLATLRKALDDAKDHLKELKRQEKEFNEDKEAKATTETEFDLDKKIDPLKKPLLDLIVDKKTTAYLYVPRASDVPSALKLRRDYGFKVVFILGPDCWKAAKPLKAAQDKWDIPMILSPQLEVIDKDPITGDETRVCTAKVFYDAGVIFSLTAVATSGRGSRQVNRAMMMPWWQVATCVRYGIPEEVAIAAFTTIPASTLGLSKRIATLEKGKDANLQILKAAPLEPECQVEYLVIDGEVVYDRTADPRVKDLTGVKTSAPEKGSR